MELEGTSRGSSGLNKAGVTSEGELLTRAIAIPDEEHAVAEGDSWGLYSGRLTMTTDARQAMIMLESQEDRDLIITGVTIGTGPSTGGANNAILVEQVGNVLSTDDIYQNGTDAIAYNRNAGRASNSFTGTVKVGPNNDFAASVSPSGVLGDFTAPSSFEVLAQIPKGGRVGLAITPPAGNTSMDITISLSFFLLEEV